MKRAEIIFGLIRIPVDAAAVCAALLLSYRLRELNIDLIPRVQLLDTATTLPPIDLYLSHFIIPAIAGFIFFAACLGLYALLTTRSAWNEIGRLLITAFIWLFAVIAWYFLVQKQLFYSRLLLIHATFFIILFGAAGRIAVLLLQRAFLHAGIGVRLAVSLGTTKIVRSARETLLHDVRYTYLGHIADVTDLKNLLNEKNVDLVIQTDPDPKSSATNTLIEFCRSQHIGYAFLPPVLADNPHQLRIDHLGLVPMLSFSPTPLDGWGRVLKRAGDIVFSGLLIVLLLPLLVALVALVVLFSGLPIFYISHRVGEQGHNNIPVLKFRTMVKNADGMKAKLATKSHRKDGPLFKLKNDPRVTSIGRVLRRWSLDELPQLFNVLVGQMSLVGPRPHLPEEVSKYTSFERRVFAVRPGITGLAQVSGRSDLSFKEEVQLDLTYIEDWSPFMDLWILWRTVFTVLRRRGSD